MPPVYLTGKDSVLYFDYTSSLDLSAPVSGPLAGILFFEDRNAPPGRLHQIGSRIAPQCWARSISLVADWS